ncbi:MAG TPA: anti-sigma factor [Casimicrobiaceae bacterium]|nr:anti-sigma factor [Casimicrobiaceae bacterium]
MGNPFTDLDVHAYADRQLAPERVAEFEDAMARDPALAARVAEIERQNAWLRAGLGTALDEPLPRRLIDAARGTPRRPYRLFAPLFAAAATLVIGLGLGWYARDATLQRAGMPTSFAREAAFAHVLYASDAKRPVEVWAPEEKQLVAWLSRRLDVPLHAPDLNAAGYALVGGRLVAGNERPTAMFMYENPARQRLTLQARKQAGSDETAFRYAVEDGVGVYYWVDDRCAYALAGNLDRAQLLAIGRLVYQQLATADDRR